MQRRRAGLLRSGLTLALVGAALAGCFRSQTALITKDRVVFPLPQNGVYASFNRVPPDDPSGATAAPSKPEVLQQYGTSTITYDAFKQVYVINEPGQTTEFVMAEIGPSTYLLQTPDENGGFDYGLAVLKGPMALFYRFGAACTDATDSVLAQNRLSLQVDNKSHQVDCFASDFDGLKDAVLAEYRAHPEPDASYILQ
jgi:hypothetical protein